MVKNLNSTMILEKLILKSNDGLIKWIQTFGYTIYDTYRYTQILTNKKYLEFNLYINLNSIQDSYLTILFSKNKNEDLAREFLGLIKCINEALLYDLIEIVRKK